MKFLNKMERKFGKYAIRNLTKYIILTYIVGYVLLLISSYSSFNVLSWLTMNPGAIMRGQVWRLVTWVLMPPGSLDVFTIIMLICYYQLGSILERTWGAFLYNVHIFFGLIMTVIGAILTSLVIAREWERGTMEALLSTEVTRVELLLCKLIPYYFLGMLAMLLCMLVAVFILGVPYRGSLVVLFFITSLFLLSTLGMGLLISTITRNQFNAAQVALNAAFLPSIMLSGFIFQIDSMPAVIRAVTYVIPARYFVSTLQSLFLAGNIPVVLIINTLFLMASAVMFIGLTWMKTKRRLD